MTMENKNFFIISNSKELVESIKRYASYVHNSEVIEICVLPLEGTEDELTLLHAYNSICAQLEKHTNEKLRNAVAILDIGLYEYSLNPISGKDQQALAAMLVLSFPEINWKFLTTLENKNNKSDQIPKEHILSYFCKSPSDSPIKDLFTGAFGFSPLFDFYGLRNSIRKDVKAKYLRIRESLTAAIDEERPYAYLHSYLLYKLGYRSLPITTMKMMTEVFGDKNNNEIDLVFEDMFLNFPDRGNRHFSNLEKRDNEFKALKNVKNRIFVTVGHKYTPAYESNKIYIRKLKYGGMKVKKVYKPSGGIYNLLKNAGLLKEYRKRRKEEWDRARPKKPKANSGSEAGHSAPGRLLAIAERLIKRAKKFLKDAMSVQDCIHGTLLALEAQELLGYKTPTTSLEAISIKHQLELKAECMFYGAGYNIDMKNRFREIKGESEAVARWFHKPVGKKLVLNAQMGIITKLIEILRDYGQFDEEQECLKKFRTLNRKWYFINKPWVLRIFSPVRAYTECLLNSFWAFLIAIILWPLSLGMIKYSLVDKQQDFFQYILQSYMTFFSFQPIETSDSMLGYFPHNHLITFLLIFFGFFHLGIFISYLYTLVSRK